MGDNGPGKAIYPRITAQVALREFRQLAVIARGKVFPDIAQLVFDDVEIVEQPFSGGRYRATLARSVADQSVRLVQNTAIFSYPWSQRAFVRGILRDRLCCCQALRVLLEPFGAKQFRPDRLLELREVDRPAVTRQAPEDLQCCPSPAATPPSSALAAGLAGTVGGAPSLLKASSCTRSNFCSAGVGLRVRVGMMVLPA